MRSSSRVAAGLMGVTLAVGSVSLAQATPRPGGSPQKGTTLSHKTSASTVDRSLGRGLGRLVADASGAAPSLRRGFKIDQEALAIRDGRNRVLVDATPATGVDHAAFRRQAESLGLVVQAVDAATGTLEGFLPLGAVQKVAGLRSLGTIAQALKPQTSTGSVTSQGVGFQRVDKVLAQHVTGKGITVGALSDSYDTATTTGDGNPLKIHAKQDVKTDDLPGKGNKAHPQPVVVIQDGDSSGEDEGRAMLQVAHDVAPDAKLCFATAFSGEVGFADNIRALADKAGPCGADVVVDDIVYYDEPMFSDSPIGDAIDSIAKKGSSYFSSAGNAGEQGGWQSPVRLLTGSAERAAVSSAHLDFSSVDPALYDGGLQDMNPGSGTDVAQSIALGGGGILDTQWNDPVDLDGPTLGPSLYSASGNLTGPTSAPSYTWKATSANVGQTIQFRADGVPSGSTDLVLHVTAPDGTDLGDVDTGTSPETLNVTIAQTGSYTITVTGFQGTTGPFTVDVRQVIAPSKTTTDFNVLLFDAAGNYLGPIADQNTLSGQPSEIADLSGLPNVQMVISRSGTGSFKATQLRTVLNGDLYFSEYVDPLAPTTFGHNTAKGASAVAAYDPFRPYLPEFYTSAGGNLPIYFDSAGNRYKAPQIRQTPKVAATDGGNTTFFGQDSGSDPDTLPNFFGTSEAAPHAAAIAALVMQQSGGPGSITPAALRSRLQRSTFVHDLDPAHASGTVQRLTVSANGGQTSEGDVAGSMTDKRFFRLGYTGKVPLRSVRFYGESASPTAPGKRNPPASDGIVFDTRAFTGTRPFGNQGFPFTVGAASGGLSRSSVSATFQVPGGEAAGSGQFRRMTVTFADGLKSGQAVRFGIDRDLSLTASGGSNQGNGADEIGGATFLPSGVVVRDGMEFKGTRVDGTSFVGVVRNQIGAGFSPVDGYGLVNAQKAVFGQ